MLTAKVILIAEDNCVIANDLAQAVEDQNGSVLGPAPSISMALALIGRRMPDAAILDGNLLDGSIVPVVLELSARHIPLVVYTGATLPRALCGSGYEFPVLYKPLLSETVIREMIERLRRIQAT